MPFALTSQENRARLKYASGEWFLNGLATPQSRSQEMYWWKPLEVVQWERFIVQRNYRKVCF